MAANYQHLRAFHAIAVEGGVTRAARRLNVSQPTLSQQLKALESRHGVALFETRRAPLKLTRAGQQLFSLTQRLFSTVAEIEQKLGETGGLSGGFLRVGSDSPFYIAKLVAVFRRRHPQIEISVRMSNARDVMRWLAESQVDAVLGSDPPADPAFSYEPLFSNTLACALPADHPLAALGAVPVQALAGEALILREESSKTRAFIERAMADAEVEPLSVLEFQNRETIREGIALGLGVSLFFDSECPPDVRLAYRPLDTGDRRYQLHSYLICPNDRRRSPLMTELRSAAMEMVRLQHPKFG